MIAGAYRRETTLAGPTPAPSAISIVEIWLAAALLGVGLLLRFPYIWHFRIDSDEPQHLHTVWVWAQGQLPYRDLFDNHAPLFQALSAPLFHLLGVRPDIVLFMRAAELPIWGLTIFCVWKISAALYSPRTALWTAVLAALCPPLTSDSPDVSSSHLEVLGLYLESIEFRPDQLWALVWMLTLLVLSTGNITPGRLFLAGILCGLNFSVSMKTTLLLLTLVQCFVGVLLVRRAAGGLPLDWPHVLRCAGAGLLGIPVIPALVILYFHLHGAAEMMYYCVIKHNVLPDSTAHALDVTVVIHWSFRIIGAVAGGYIISRLEQPISVRTRIGFVFFAALLYEATLDNFWPIVTGEDFLPLYPAAMLTLGPAALWLAGLALRSIPISAGAVLASAELVRILVVVSPFQDKTADKIGEVADTLKLTDPSDYVMDSKGETIYRNRPFRYVLETLTNHRIQMGLIEDDIPERVIKTRAPLATDKRMPKRGKNFIKENYLPIAWRLLVLGKVVRIGNDRSNKPQTFEVAVPQRYTLITPSGPPAGMLDGMPFTGPRELEAGTHTFVPETAHGDIVLIWAAALERGYSPFAPIKKDVRTPQD